MTASGDFRLNRDFLIAAMSTFLYFTAAGALIPTLPRYVNEDLEQTAFWVGVVVGAFSVAALLFRYVAGQLTDLFGPARAITIGGALFSVSILLYPTIDSVAPLAALRFISGMGEAAFFVGAASCIAASAPEERRGEAFSYFSIALYGGLILGPLLGEESFESSGFAGVCVLAGSLAGGSSICALFLTRRREGLGRDRGKDKSLRGLLSGMLMGTTIFGLAAFLSFAPLAAIDLGLEHARYVFALYAVTVLSVRLAGARIPDAMGPRRVAVAGALLSAAGLGTVGGWQTVSGLYLGTFVLALGQALAFPAFLSLATSSPGRAGRSIGIFAASLDLAFATGAMAAGAVADQTSLATAFVFVGVVAAAGGLVAASPLASSVLDRPRPRNDGNQDATTPETGGKSTIRAGERSRSSE